MDWDGFRLVLSLARHRRVSLAASELGVEHTTVSRRLEAFERELGCKLFYRTVAGYQLTPDGEAAVESAKAMEQAARSTRHQVAERATDLAGRVRLALLEELASFWLVPKLPVFRARYPRIDLDLKVGARPLDLSRGEADLAIRTPRPRQTGLSALRLARTRAGLYAARSLTGGEALAVEDLPSLRGHPLLVFSREHHALQSAPWLQPVLEGASIALVTNSTATLLAAARAGLGVAVLPRLVVRAEDDLVPVSADTAVHDMWLVSHPELRREPCVRAVAQFLKQAAGGPAGLR